MKIVDVNVLLYAINQDSEQHAPARAWLEEALSGSERIALPWIVILAFLRLVTSPRVFPKPMASADALATVDAWLSRPQVVTLSPTDDHWPELRSLLERTGTAANLTTDAHLAALALEHSAELCSFDSDFARFPGLRWIRPGV